MASKLAKSQVPIRIASVAPRGDSFPQVWAFHGLADRVIPAEYTQRTITALHEVSDV
jgi:hypothetical protein